MSARRRLAGWLTPRRTAALAAAGFVLIASFEVALALGAPWGEAAWGGGEAELSTEMRAASLVAAGVWTGAALIVLRRGGYWGEMGSRSVLWGTRLIAVLLLFGGALNLASSSGWERFGWAPLALVLAALTFRLTRHGRVEGGRTATGTR